MWASPSSGAGSIGWRDAGGALLLYAALLALFVAPAAARLASELIATSDDRYLYLWSAWWVRESLFAAANPYFTQLLYAPDGAPLVFHTLSMLPSMAAAALSPALGPVVAYNVVGLALTCLAGLGGYAFCRQVVPQRAAAWLGGATFMLSPFTTGKLTHGWVNLLCVGWLALFAACFVRATDPQLRPGSRARLWLALSAAALAFSSEHLAVMAAWTGLFVCGWRLLAEPSAATLGRLVRAGWPAALAVAPYVAIVASYALRLDLSVPVRPPEIGFSPGLASYLLPLHVNSIHAPWVSELGLREGLFKQDLACYLGVLVFPLAAIGLWRARRRPAAQLCIALGLAFLVVTFGPSLVWDGEYVHLLGRRVPLPARALAALPVLGAVAQSGRYMALVYLAIAAGVACFAAAPPEALRRRLGAAGVPALLALVALDYGFTVSPRALPVEPELVREGRVLARVDVYAPPLYFQTLDERPLIAGPISRPLRYALDRYRERPGLSCWLFRVDEPPCDWARFPEEIDRLAVTGAWLVDSDAVRAQHLREAGFAPVTAHGRMVLWQRPLPAVAAP
jgi:hypothetical protein